jgi:hypothetical protein
MEYEFMALIEYLEQENWADVLRRSFEVAIVLLQTDRFCLTSSAVDDVRAWLTSGGVSRVRFRLDGQMKDCRFTSDRQRDIQAVLNQLVREKQQALMQLIADGIIPWNQADFLVTFGLSEAEFNAMWHEVSLVTNPFETWMLAQGYAQETIDVMEQKIKRWLIQKGLRLPE